MRISCINPHASAFYALAFAWLVACGGPPAARQFDQLDPIAVTPPTDVHQGDAHQPHTNDLLTSIYLDVVSLDSNKRLAVIEELNVLPPSQSTAIIERLLWDSDLDVREAALESMLETQTQGTVASLALLMTDADPELRQTVVDSLADRGGAMAISLLREATYDPDYAVREAAFDGLEELDTRF